MDNLFLEWSGFPLDWTCHLKCSILPVNVQIPKNRGHVKRAPTRPLYPYGYKCPKKGSPTGVPCGYDIPEEHRDGVLREGETGKNEKPSSALCIDASSRGDASRWRQYG
jgi:hypothetical protein